MNRITAMKQTSFIPKLSLSLCCQPRKVVLIFIRIWLNLAELKWTISLRLKGSISLNSDFLCWICDVHDQQQKGKYTITRWWFSGFFFGIFTSKFGEMIQFDLSILFSMALKPPARKINKHNVYCFRNLARKPLQVGSSSHYLQGFLTSQVVATTKR